MGTVNNDLMPFYRECICTFKDTDYQVIMSVGNLVSVEEFEELPENISVFQYVDQIAVLKKADVFVSHAGMNSVNESLYFEVPIVTLPQTAEQTGVANRVIELGAGIKPDKTDGISILITVNKILNDATYKKNASKISFTDGTSKVVDVEKLLLNSEFYGSGKVTIKISDTYCPWNNDCFTLEFGDNIVVTRGGKPDIEMDIKSFTSAILGRFDFDSCRIFPDVKVYGNEENLKKIFFKKTCFIEEHF